MDNDRHHISGFFSVRADAEKALDALLERGLPRERVQIFDANTPTQAPVPREDSNAVLKDVLVVEARTREETSIAKDVISASVGDYKVVSLA